MSRLEMRYNVMEMEILVRGADPIWKSAWISRRHQSAREPRRQKIPKGKTEYVIRLGFSHTKKFRPRFGSE